MYFGPVEDIKSALGLFIEAKKKEGITPADEKVFDIGAMIETIKSVEDIDAILKNVKFISFGTNDLTSNLYPDANRLDESSFKKHYEQVLPGLIRVIEYVTVKARAKGVEVSICGDLAALPAFWGSMALLEKQRH